MKLTSIFLSVFIFTIAYSQQTISYNSSEILHEIEKLNTVGSVLYIAAHPDDENTRLIAYLTNKEHLRTGYLSLTRGDGGQNLIGKEQGDALGLIRTQELLAARRMDGAEQFFTRANDFGFSKNPEETFSIWNKDSILSDVVLTIRRFKPDVIICRFPTTGEGGHGHHTASAILAMEAFDAAADASKFPEQLKETEVWQTKRIYWNTFNFGFVNTTSSSQLQLDVGKYNALLGKNYGEIASASRTMHKSQGFGVPMQRGEEVEFFKYLKGDKKPKKDIFENIDFSWKRFPQTEQLEKLLLQTQQEFQAAHPEKTVNILKEIHQELRSLKNVDPLFKQWKTLKLKACEELILQCSGLWMEAYPEEFSTVPGEQLKINTQIITRNNPSIQLQSLTFLGQKKSINKTLQCNELTEFSQEVKIDEKTAFSNPYWLNEEHTNARYLVKEIALIGKPENDPAGTVEFELSIDGFPLTVTKPLVYKYSDPIKGEVYRPFEILPPATVNINSKVYIFNSDEGQEVTFTIKAHKDKVKGQLKINLPESWSIEFEDDHFDLAKKGDEIHLVGILKSTQKGANDQLTAELKIDGKTYPHSLMRITYDHIPYQFFLYKASAKIVHLDLKLSEKKNIAYLPGAGDDVAKYLMQIGYQVTLVDNEFLEKEDLAQFDCILTGIRAYNVNKRMPLYYEKLMKYVEDGGNLIVQYNTNNRIAPLEDQIGPYPFTIDRNRVTDEKAEVEFLNPAAKVLNFPNSITSVDFEGWVQERGIYFAETMDKKYETVFSMHDAGEKPRKGSLIIGEYGKGHFVYTGLVFFREIPAGVPGAYRLLVNILSL